jgi:hypothetical protein
MVLGHQLCEFRCTLYFFLFLPLLISTHSQFTIFVCILFILPTVRPVTQFNMNYAIVSVGGIFLIVGITWVLWGRFSFKGPVHTNVNIEVDGLQDEKGGS